MCNTITEITSEEDMGTSIFVCENLSTSFFLKEIKLNILLFYFDIPNI